MSVYRVTLKFDLHLDDEAAARELGTDLIPDEEGDRPQRRSASVVYRPEGSTKLHNTEPHASLRAALAAYHRHLVETDAIPLGQPDAAGWAALADALNVGVPVVLSGWQLTAQSRSGSLPRPSTSSTPTAPSAASTTAGSSP